MSSPTTVSPSPQCSSRDSSLPLLQIRLRQRPQKRPSHRLHLLPALLALLHHLLGLHLGQQSSSRTALPLPLPLPSRRPPSIVMTVIVVVLVASRPRLLSLPQLPLFLPPTIPLPPRLPPISPISALVRAIPVPFAVVLRTVPAVVVVVRVAVSMGGAPRFQGRDVGVWTVEARRTSVRICAA
jgi:hypothetical protein